MNFLNTNTEDEAKYFSHELHKNNKSISKLYNELTDSSNTPYREISWELPEPDEIRKALFSDTLSVGQKIGPIKIGRNYLFMEILGWRSTVPFSEKTMIERWNMISEKLTEERGLDLYGEYIAGIMKGKSVDMNPDVFGKLAQIIAPKYVKTEESKDDQFLEYTFDKKKKEVRPNKDISSEISDIINEPLVNFDGQTWTVGDLERELDLHPFVFRNQKVNEKNFLIHLKLAIVDLIRDKYLTNEAYKAGLDKTPYVKRYTSMWQDALVSLYEKQSFVKDEAKTYNNIKEDIEPEIRKLLEKYSKQIEIDTELFNSIKLTRTEMFAIQKNVPFPVMVPGFPQIYTEHSLDYGVKMENTNRKGDK